MSEVVRLFQAFLAPAIFVSATGLLILSVNVRLMGMVSRLRHYVHAKYDAAKNDRLQQAEAYTDQIRSIEHRAEMIRRCFLFVLLSLAATVAACLLLGLGLYWTDAAIVAAAVFVLGLISLLIGTIYYIREVMVALSSVQQEARDSRFMDLGTPPEVREHTPVKTCLTSAWRASSLLSSISHRLREFSVHNHCKYQHSNNLFDAHRTA
jgi:hypothetical protein